MKTLMLVIGMKYTINLYHFF